MRAFAAPRAEPSPQRALAAAKALLPALFLAQLTFWSGTFAGGATFAGAASAHAGLLALCLLGGARWRDPLTLGRLGRWLVPALLLLTVASWLSGPVPRAGVVAVTLLPACLLMPAAVATCWRTSFERRLGLGALGLLLGLVAAVALLRWQADGSSGAAMPLGNSNLMAVWLVILWPVGLASLTGLRVARILVWPAAALVVLALSATHSLLAVIAVVVQALLAAVWWRRARAWLAVAVLALCLGPEVAARASEWKAAGRPAADSPAPDAERGTLRRVADMASGRDDSLRARVALARAGWVGMRERPLLGWGPASVPWTAARFVEPVGGRGRPSEVVGDLHSLPVQLAYETGLAGIGLIGAIGWLFARRRLQELAETEERTTLESALVGLVGGTVMLVGNAAIAVLALPAALAIVAGAALACAPQRPPGPGRAALGIGILYLLPAALTLLPLDRAHLSYQRALGAETRAAALAHLRRAHELDPAFSLYQARSAWLAAELGWADEAVAEEARRAAVATGHVAPLWLAAGALGLDAGRPWAEEALQRARRLDPLAPLPAFHLLRARPTRRDAVELGVAAVLGDERLAKAVFWDEHPSLHAAVLARLNREAHATRGPRALLVQSMDTGPSFAVSLFAFRRSSWPADIAAVEVYR